MSDKKTKQLSLQTIGVKTILTSDLNPNPHNPRMLFDREPLTTLQNSIDRVGILVPLTVYQNHATGKFVILDGQRRWLCAQELGLTVVPVNQVAEPSTVQNIVTMFQIHRLREDWELMPTALKLELLMLELQEKNEKRLATLTGLNIAVVARCKKLLSYPKRFQDMMLDPDPEKRVKADFFIELYPVVTDRAVKSMPWFSRGRFTQNMLDRYQNRKGGLKAVTDFRMMKQHLTNARRDKKIKSITKKLKEFTDNDSLTLDHLAIKSADVTAGANRLLKSVEKLTADLKNIDSEEYYGQEDLWRSLENLRRQILLLLIKADRRVKE